MIEPAAPPRGGVRGEDRPRIAAGRDELLQLRAFIAQQIPVGLELNRGVTA